MSDESAIIARCYAHSDEGRAEYYYETGGQRTQLGTAEKIMGCTLPEVVENTEEGVFTILGAVTGSWEKATLKRVDFRGLDIKLGLEKRFGSLDSLLLPRRDVHPSIRSLYRRRNNRGLDGDSTTAFTIEDIGAITATGAFEAYFVERTKDQPLTFRAIQIP